MFDWIGVVDDGRRGAWLHRKTRGRCPVALALWRRRGVAGFASSLALAMSIFSAMPTPVMAQDTRILDLLANDLVYDPVSERIYASVPSADGPERGNSITVIEPVTGTIESSVFVGSEPGPLAVSDDGQFVYVGLDGAGAIRRYDIATATAGLLVPLGVDSLFGTFFAADIEVLPGAAHSIAISRKFHAITPSHAGVAIYDDDVMRPTTTFHTGFSNRIEFAESASLLYGANNETPEFGFRQMSVNVDGVTETAVQPGLISDFGVDIEFEQGIVYTTGSRFTDGNAIDPDAMTIIGSYAAHGLVEADATLGKVYFLEGDEFAGWTLNKFDLASFMLEDTMPLFKISGSARSLIRWGADGLAFNTTGGQIFLINEIAPPRNPECVVELDRGNGGIYRNGDAVVATSLLLANPTPQIVSFEGRLWFDRPDNPPFAKTGILPTGRVDLLPGDSQEFGPVTLGTVSSGLARGQYAFDCRLIDPVTADHRALDVNSFRLE